MMDRCLDIVEDFIADLTLWDFAMLKLGLFSAGVMAAASLPPKCRRPAAAAAGIVFAGTCLSLAAKFAGHVTSGREEA